MHSAEKILKKNRLDERLVELGLVESRSRAQALILAGRVLVNDQPVDKAGTQVPEEAMVRIRGEDSRFVSRGGEKLAGALEDLGVNPEGMLCLDLGASTGGFTDCLLQAGASRVIAVDVGHNQLALKLRQDDRVEVLERVNARHLSEDQIATGVELVTMDVSFISSRLILPAVTRVAPQADCLIMVKPQFEVGREQVGKGGVVRDDALRAQAVRDVCELAESLGYQKLGQADSRLQGPKGNREIFIWLRPQGKPEEGE